MPTVPCAHWPFTKAKYQKEAPPAPTPRCLAINNFVFAYLHKSMPDAIILSTAPFYYLIDIPHLMAQTVVSCANSARQPWSWSAPRQSGRTRFNPHRSRIRGQRITRRRPRYSRSTAGGLERISRLDVELEQSVIASGAAYVSAFRLLCQEQRCTVLIGGEPVAHDNFHLTLHASTRVARAIQNSLTQLVTGAIR